MGKDGHKDRIHYFGARPYAKSTKDTLFAQERMHSADPAIDGGADAPRTRRLGAGLRGAAAHVL